MTHQCPKCGRYGMQWDARAKILLCYWRDCQHVIRGLVPQGDWHTIPSDEAIRRAIEEDRNPPACLKDTVAMSQTRLLLTRDNNTVGDIVLWITDRTLEIGKGGVCVPLREPNGLYCMAIESESECQRIAGFIPERGECVECRIVRKE